MGGTGGISVAPLDIPKPKVPRSGMSGTMVAAVLAGALVVIFAIGWAGWALNTASHPSKDVTVTRVFDGTVTTVNTDGNAGCLQPDGGGATVCSGLYVDRGLAKVRVGQRVHAAFEDSAAFGTMLLIYPRSS